jgi:ATP-dependent Lhr-like helicase
MTAWVRAAKGKRIAVPRWAGGRMSLSNELGYWLQHTLSDSQSREREMLKLKPLLDLQTERSALPQSTQLLIERIKARDGDHLIVFPFAGRLVHEGLGALLAQRLSKFAPVTLTFGANDYGVIVSSSRLPDLELDDLAKLLSAENVRDDLLAGIGMAELARRQFREIARIAGLVFSSQPGRDKSIRHLQAGTGLIYDVLAQHDPNHILLQQATEEVLERTYDVNDLEACLLHLANRQIVFTQPRNFTPFAFPLWSEWTRGALSSEDWESRVKRLAAELDGNSK